MTHLKRHPTWRNSARGWFRVCSSDWFSIRSTRCARVCKCAKRLPVGLTSWGLAEFAPALGKHVLQPRVKKTVQRFRSARSPRGHTERAFHSDLLECSRASQKKQIKINFEPKIYYFFYYMATNRERILEHSLSFWHGSGFVFGCWWSRDRTRCTI